MLNKIKPFSFINSQIKLINGLIFGAAKRQSLKALW